MFAILCYATPVFFLGLMLKLVFAVWLNVLPPSGRSSFASDMQFQRLVSPTGFYIIDAFQLGDMSVLVDVLRHAVLPALALGLLTAGVFIRLVRTTSSPRTRPATSRRRAPAACRRAVCCPSTPGDPQ